MREIHLVCVGKELIPGHPSSCLPSQVPMMAWGVENDILVGWRHSYGGLSLQEYTHF
jgi:hypothetical protein